MKFTYEDTAYGPAASLSKFKSMPIPNQLYLIWRLFPDSANLRIVWDTAGKLLYAESYDYPNVTTTKKWCDRENEMKHAVSSLSSRVSQLVITEVCWGTLSKYRLVVGAAKF